MEEMGMSDIDALEQDLRSKPPLERELAARRLLAAGGRGLQVLATVAMDVGAPSSVRVTALRHLPEHAPIEDTLRALLEDALPVLRLKALEKAEKANAKALASLVEKLTTDPAIVWDLDDEHVVATVAARVLAVLRG